MILQLCRIFLSGLLILLQLFSYGQSLKELNNQEIDSNQVQQLLDLAYNLEIENPDSALLLYEQAAEKAQIIDYKIGQGRALQYSGIVLSDQGKYDESIDFYLRAIDVFKTIPYPAGEASTYVNIGNIYKRKAEYAKAIDNYIEGIRILEQLGDTARLIYAYTNIGSVLSDVELYEKSLEYNKRSFEISTVYKDSLRICDGLLNIGMVESNMGLYDAALSNFNKSLIIAKKIDDDYLIFLSNNNIASVFASQNKAANALEYSKRSLVHAKPLNNPALISQSMASIGANFMNLGKLDSAYYYLDNSIKIAQESQALEVLISAYLWMAELKEKMNLPEEALLLYKRYQLLQDEASGERQKRIIVGLEIEYQIEKKDLELSEKSLEIERNEALLAKRNYFIITLFGALVSTLIFFLLLRSRLRQKRIIAEKDAALKQDKLIQLKKDQQVLAYKSMMEGEEKERLRLAKDLHDGLGGLLSSTKLQFSNIQSDNKDLQDSSAFKKAIELLDTTSSEARKISHNLMPGALVKFGLVDALDDFCISLNSGNTLKVIFQSFGLNDRLPEAIEIMVYRIAQELVNNIVKHANASEAIVQLMLNEKTLFLTVEDNGCGFNPDSLESEGIGMNNIRSRVELLNAKLAINSEIDVGTTVSIEIELKD